VQYGQTDVEYLVEHTYQQVRTKEDIDSILVEIEDENLVLFSIIELSLSDYFSQLLEDRDILHLNVLEPMLETVSKFLGVHPNYRPGILQIVDDQYYRKIDAIRYTVAHDDGLGSSIEQADAVLLGLSRSCKTPISVFLACNYGLRVANIPIVRDPNITEMMIRRLQSIDPAKIIGLMINSETLAQMREERSESDVKDAKGILRNYYHIDAVKKEIRYCRDLYHERDLWTVNVTNRAIEEISKEILKLLGEPSYG
jgi:regulator of PEP synthase PpsR (kinase-PPPase family)